MNKGLWVWPPDQRGQRRMLVALADSPHLVAAMTALGKSKEGMSDSELAEAISEPSEWPVLWVVRQLTSLGFVEYHVDLFGNPARYTLTELGQNVFSTVTGKPPAPKPTPAAVPPTPGPKPAPVPLPPAPKPT